MNEQARHGPVVMKEESNKWQNGGSTKKWAAASSQSCQVNLSSQLGRDGGCIEGVGDREYDQGGHCHKVQKPAEVKIVEDLTQRPCLVHRNELGGDEGGSFDQIKQPEMFRGVAEAEENEERIQHAKRERKLIESFPHSFCGRPVNLVQDSV